MTLLGVLLQWCPVQLRTPPHTGARLTKSNQIRVFSIFAASAMLITIASTMSLSTRAAPAVAIPQIVAHEFTLHDHGDYFEIRQPDYRRIFIDSKALQAFIHYEPGQGLASQSTVPSIFIHVGGHQYRLDCVDDEAVETFIAFAKKEMEQP